MSSTVVFVDDTDTSIQYDDGLWVGINNTQNVTGLLAAPFQNTLHFANASASLHFSFNGMFPFILLIFFQALSLLRRF